MADSIITRLLFNMELWARARLMPFQVSSNSLEKTLKLAKPTGSAIYLGLPIEYIIDRVVWAARRPWLMRDRRCLRQGLLGFRFLREAGHDPRLIFGVDPSSLPNERLSAHCWIEIEGKTVLGMQEMSLLTIYVYPGDDDQCP